MTFDWTIRIADLLTVLAIIAGPIVAVQIAEALRNRKEQRDRRLWIFRTLMSTRSSPLVLDHIQALNVVDVEFHSSRPQDKKVVDAWKLYLAHLNDHAYPRESWGSRKADLLMELLHEMSVSLGYSFDKSHIKSGTYYPAGYDDADLDQWETRKLFLQVLRNERAICFSPMQNPSQQQDQTS